MPIGLILFDWDVKAGANVEAKYPESIEIPNALLNKIYMTHAYDEQYKNDELIEVNYKDQTIISYCDKSRVPEVGYEVLILIVHEREKVFSYRYKSKIISLGRNLFVLSREKRKKYFFENVQGFFEKPPEKKLLLLGRAGTGKTSVKKIIFEGQDPNLLLSNPLEPTRGIMPSIYSWLDLSIGLFDTAGQELNYLLKTEDEQIFAFEKAEVIIYLLDYSTWVINSTDVIEELKKTIEINSKHQFSAKIVVFLHKIDLIEEDIRENMFVRIRNEITNKVDVPIFFTSIYPNLLYTTYNAFYEILSNFSEETTAFKRIINEILKNIVNTMCFITNENDSIIVQSMTSDFNTSLINHSHKLIIQLNQSFEDMTLNDSIEHLILCGSNNLNIIMKNLNLLKFNLKNIILISESLSTNKMIMLVGNIRISLNRYLFKLK